MYLNLHLKMKIERILFLIGYLFSRLQGHMTTPSLHQEVVLKIYIKLNNVSVGQTYR